MTDWSQVWNPCPLRRLVEAVRRLLLLLVDAEGYQVSLVQLGLVQHHLAGHLADLEGSLDLVEERGVVLEGLKLLLRVGELLVSPDEVVLDLVVVGLGNASSGGDRGGRLQTVVLLLGVTELLAQLDDLVAVIAVEDLADPGRQDVQLGRALVELSLDGIAEGFDRRAVLGRTSAESRCSSGKGEGLLGAQGVETGGAAGSTEERRLRLRELRQQLTQRGEVALRPLVDDRLQLEADDATGDQDLVDQAGLGEGGLGAGAEVDAVGHGGSFREGCARIRTSFDGRSVAVPIKVGATWPWAEGWVPKYWVVSVAIDIIYRYRYYKY